MMNEFSRQPLLYHNRSMRVYHMIAEASIRVSGLYCCILRVHLSCSHSPCHQICPWAIAPTWTHAATCPPADLSIMKWICTRQLRVVLLVGLISSKTTSSDPQSPRLVLPCPVHSMAVSRMIKDYYKTVYGVSRRSLLPLHSSLIASELRGLASPLADPVAGELDDLIQVQEMVEGELIVETFDFSRCDALVRAALRATHPSNARSLWQKNGPIARTNFADLELGAGVGVEARENLMYKDTAASAISLHSDLGPSNPPIRTTLYDTLGNPPQLQPALIGGDVSRFPLGLPPPLAPPPLRPPGMLPDGMLPPPGMFMPQMMMGGRGSLGREQMNGGGGGTPSEGLNIEELLSAPTAKVSPSSQTMPGLFAVFFFFQFLKVFSHRCASKSPKLSSANGFCCRDFCDLRNLTKCLAMQCRGVSSSSEDTTSFKMCIIYDERMLCLHQEQQVLDSGAELRDLLAVPTAKHSITTRQFQSQGGSRVQQICRHGTRHECLLASTHAYNQNKMKHLPGDSFPRMPHV
eukprot:284817514_1